MIRQSRVSKKLKQLISVGFPPHSTQVRKYSLSVYGFVNDSSLIFGSLSPFQFWLKKSNPSNPRQILLLQPFLMLNLSPQMTAGSVSLPVQLLVAAPEWCQLLDIPLHISKFWRLECFTSATSLANCSENPCDRINVIARYSHSRPS